MQIETTSTARAAEAQILARCLAVAGASCAVARDQREANVFRLGSQVLPFRYAAAARRLGAAGKAYLDDHPAELLSDAEVIRRSWVVSVPRLVAQLSAGLDESA